MRPRDIFEAQCHAALARHKQAIADGTWHVTADNTLVDTILKAWEKSLVAEARHLQRWAPVYEALSEVARG